MNVQPYSGSPANLAVYLAFCNAGDTIMGLGLPAGGHLTHGHSVSITGKYFKSVPYGVRKDDHRIDMDQVRDARAASTSRSSSGAAPRRTRAPSISPRSARSPTRSAPSSPPTSRTSRGSSAAGVHPSPVGIADVVTSTTHKTFRGPRGGMIFCKKEHAAAIDKAVFPGLQGGPHNHTTAAIAVAAHEASQPAFKAYAQAIVENAQGARRGARGARLRLVTGGTDNHLLLVDLTPKGVTGKHARAGARPRGHRPQLQRHPVRPAQALRSVGPPHRHAGGHVARDGHRRDGAARRLDRPRHPEAHGRGALAKIAAEVKDVCAKYPAPGIRL